MSGKRFGEFVRREREAEGDRLAGDGEDDRRKPNLSFKVERDEFPPPAEDKVKAIAAIIKVDVDELLARAGKVASELSDIIKRHPVHWRRCCGPQRA